MKKMTKRKQRWIERTIANDRSYKLFLYNRFFMFLIFVLLQLVSYVFLWFLFVYHTSVGVIFQVLTGILMICVLLYLLNKNDRPSVKLNWIIIILIAPILGVPMYILYGEGRPTWKMNRKILQAKAENRARMQEIYGEREVLQPNERNEAIGHYLSQYADYPVFHDGEIEYYKSGEEMFPHMLEAMQKAEKYILLEYFIIAHGKMWNEMRKVLLEKAEQGVQIRIIYDDFGCMMTLPPKYDRYLESLHENIRCLAFNQIVPLFAVRMNNRDHKKILVVDGKVAFTGGINIADEYIAEKQRFGYWKDTGLKITGGAVRSFVQMFFYMWNAFRKDKEDIAAYLPASVARENAQGKQWIQPYDDSPFDKISVAETVYLDMIERATKSLYIFTPYLLLDDFVRGALCRAAARGVDVRIVTPGIPDKKMVYRLTRANYQILMRSGIKIYEYTPGFIHAKSMVCDNESAVVGTINLDYRSLYFHFENAVYFSGCEAVSALTQDCEEVFAVSTLRTPENTKRGVVGRVVDSVLRVFETLL